MMQISSESDSDSDKCRVYNISVSKFCCSVCWKLIEVLNKMNKKVQFIVRKKHPNNYPVCLPPWISVDILEEMISRLEKMLYEKFCQLRGIKEPSEFIRGHSKNTSLESAGESVSSAGTIVDEETKNADHQVGLSGLTPSRTRS
jgi:hypothetical protein